jgi:hypothetical protein
MRRRQGLAAASIPRSPRSARCAVSSPEERSTPGRVSRLASRSPSEANISGDGNLYGLCPLCGIDPYENDSPMHPIPRKAHTSAIFTVRPTRPSQAKQCEREALVAWRAAPRGRVPRRAMATAPGHTQARDGRGCRSQGRSRERRAKPGADGPASGRPRAADHHIRRPEQGRHNDRGPPQREGPREQRNV